MEENNKTTISEKISIVLSYMYIPLTVLYLESAIRIKCSIPVFQFWGIMVLFSLSFGILLNFVILIPKSEKVKKSIAIIAIFLLCLYSTVETFVCRAYQVFMNIAAIFLGTKGVVTDFSDSFFLTIKSGFFTIVAFFLPFIVFTILCITKKFTFDFEIPDKYKTKSLIGLPSVSIIAFAIALITVFSNQTTLGLYRNAYNFNNATCSFGLVTGTRLDIQYEIFGNPSFNEFVPNNEEHEIIITPVEDEQQTEGNPEVVYGYNITDIDFEKLILEAPDKTIANIHQYVSGLSGTKQNQYTGLFRGKNLILIAAESFSAEVIDKEKTPTLYRLANNGIKFDEFYQPTWGGSTSTGEFSIFTGLIPTDGVQSMYKITDGHDLSFTIGNKLINEGYFSAAYHNGTYTYYSRNLTHTKFGYDTFTAFGNGLEKGVNTEGWPASDLEMMEYTLPQYIDKEPFSIYYMSVSGHGFYTGFQNAMSEKNYDEVKDMDYSETVQAYFAANYELEHALSYLVGELEHTGIADDTVIVICADHYPYALEEGESWGNDEDYLAELYGYKVRYNYERDHNACIIWSGCLENENKEMATEIISPCYSLDILPTLCNLFGVEYDSRLLVGRDVLSDTPALVIWPDFSWKTDSGYYNYNTNEFIPSNENIPYNQQYIDSINNTVKNKINYSKAVLNYDYFKIIKSK